MSGPYSSIITTYLGEDIAANRPTTVAVPPLSLALFYATDTKSLSLWNGSGWDTPAGSGTVTDIVVGTGLQGGPTITSSGTISLGTIAAGDLLGNPGTVGAIPTAVVVGSGLTLSVGGTLSSTSGGGSVTSVIAQAGPFLANGTITSAGTIDNSTTSLTNHAILLGAGTAAVTALGGLGTATTVLHGNATGAPGFSAVDLAADVTGLLPFANIATLSASSLFGNAGTVGATGSNVAIGTGLSLSTGGTLSATSAGGNVSNTGTPVSGQAAEWTAANIIQGVSVTGTGNYVKATGAVLVGPTLGTPASVTLTNGTNLPLTTGVTGRLPFANLATIDAVSLFGNGTTAGATGGPITVGSGLTLTPSGTLSATASGGTVTQVVAQGGPFLASGTITSSGTISNSTASLTTHGVVIAEGTGAVVATAAMSNGQLLIGATGADPAPQTVSGALTINSGGTAALTNTAVTPGSYGDATHYTTFTVGSDGRLTAAGTQAAAAGSVTQVIAGSNLNVGAGPGGTITAIGTLNIQPSPTFTATAGSLPAVVNANSVVPTVTMAATVLQIVGAPAANSRLLIDSFGAAPVLTLRRADGTAASPTAVQLNDVIGSLSISSYGSTTYGGNRTFHQIFAAENWTDAAQGYYQTFSNVAAGGTVLAENLRLTDTGIFLVGTNAASGTRKLQVVGGATIDSLQIGTSTAITKLGTTLVETSGTLDINLGSVNSWTAAQRSVPVALTSAATVTPDFSAGNNFAMTMTVSGTLANPTNVVAGQAGQLAITQDGTGGRTLALGSVFKTAAGAGITLTTTAAATDILSYYVWNSTLVAISPGLNFK